jgi:uncharacterized protein YdaU (DUF1376 family)
MPLDIEDYLADTTHLSAAEHGAYLLLIMRYWKDGGLPQNERLVQSYSRLSAEQWAESRDIIAAFFDDGWRHKRIDAELARAANIIEKRRAAANTRHHSNKSNAHDLHVESNSSDTGVPPSTSNPPSSLRSEGARERRANPNVVLQGELDAVAASRWVSHCEEKGKRLSIAQAEQQCAELRALKAAGGNASEAIRFAIDKGWVTLKLEYFRNNGFPLKTAAPPPDIDWESRLVAWRRDPSSWIPGWGPPPGERGCKAPPELLKSAA